LLKLIAITQPALYSNHTGCAALAIRKKYEKKSPSLQENEIEREREISRKREREIEREKTVSLPHTFLLLHSFFRPFSNEKAMQKKPSLQ
jgi:hypothetical protein